MKTKAALALTLSLGTILSSAAFAQTAATTSSTSGTAPASKTKVSSSHDEAVVVLGIGKSRETQTISRASLVQMTPGTSPEKALSKLPGVMFQSSDPLGSYEWSQQLIIRGFDQSRLGFTFDDIPLGNQSYGNDNGLSIGRALEDENNGPVTLSQGAGSVGVAASNALGGAVQYTSIDPTKKYGVDIGSTVGSAGAYREFIRINSGILPGGGKFYVSYDYGDTNKWKGDGQQKQQQANIKFVQPINENVKLTLFGDWDQRRENDYQDLSLATIKKYGYSVDNITNNYKEAEQIGYDYQNGLPGPAGIGTTNYGDIGDFEYFNAAGLRNDELGYGKLDFRINDRLKGYVSVYGHENTGEGVWVTPDTPTPSSIGGGDPLSTRTTEYDIHREGLVSSLSYRAFDNNTIEGGFWFENNIFEQARRYYPLSESGAPNSLYWYQGDSFDTAWQGVFTTRTYQFHLQDDWRLSPKLKLNVGFRSLIVDENAKQLPADDEGVLSDSGYPSGSVTASNGFLPQAGLTYEINHHNEVFVDFARNMDAYDNSNTGATSPFATTEAAYNLIKNDLKPETSNQEEIGYRYHDYRIQASVTGYYVEFSNRLLEITQGTGIEGEASTLANVGGVTSRGIDLAGNWNFWGNWSLYGSYAFNDSRYDQNVTSDDVTYRTAGKDVVAMPRNLAYLQLGYDDGSWWGNINMQYTDRRTYTYTNDAWVPSYAIFNLAMGYRFTSNSFWLKGLEAQVDVTNLFNKDYVATVGTNGFEFSDPDHTFATLQAGSPQMVFFTLRKHFF